MTKIVVRLALLGATLACCAGVAYGKPQSLSPLVPTVTVNTPTGTLLKLKTSELALLPQQTVTITSGGQTMTESGPLLSALVALAGVQYSTACRNDELRWWIQATNAKAEAVTLTAGELNTGFGNKPAILSISENGHFLTTSGPRLIVPNDPAGARNLRNVSIITVGRATAQLADATKTCAATSQLTTPAPGTVTINGAVANPGSYTFAQLQGLPAVSQTVSFLSGTTPNTNTENGPTLASIIQAAKPKFLACDPNDKLRWYVMISSGLDGYTSLLSWPEIDPSVNGNLAVMSLTENGTSQSSVGPRLTVPGDVRGGRYVSGSAVVTLFRAPTQLRIPGCAKAKS